jgi:nucleoside-diphosphate-sugar epimerase
MVVFGCGYVGSSLVKEAVRRGYRVTVLSRGAARFEELPSSAAVERVVADLATDEWHSRIDPRPDVVINCVGSGGGGVEGYRRSYVEGMESIARWLSAGEAGVAIYTGSIGVYSRNDGSLVDETAEVGGHSVYADLLLDAERCFLAPGFSAGRRFVLRLAGIYGPGRHAFLDRVRGSGGVLPGRGEGYMNAIHLEDVCGAVWAAIDRSGTDAGGVYNVVDDLPARRSEVAAWLASRLGVPCPRFDDTKSSPGRSGRVRNRRISNDKIKSRLGWQPRYPNFRQGYEEILKALRKNK